MPQNLLVLWSAFRLLFYQLTVDSFYQLSDEVSRRALSERSLPLESETGNCLTKHASSLLCPKKWTCKRKSTRIRRGGAASVSQLGFVPTETELTFVNFLRVFPLAGRSRFFQVSVRAFLSRPSAACVRINWFRSLPLEDPFWRMVLCGRCLSRSTAKKCSVSRLWPQGRCDSPDRLWTHVECSFYSEPSLYIIVHFE